MPYFSGVWIIRKPKPGNRLVCENGDKFKITTFCVSNSQLHVSATYRVF